MTEPDLQKRRGEWRGGSGHPDPEIRGGPISIFFRPFGPQFGVKVRGAGPLAPPLDPPLLTNEIDRNVRHLKRSWERVFFCLPERGEEKEALRMPKSGQAFEVPDAQNSGIVNLVLYHQTSFPGLLNVSGKLPTYPSP